MFYLLTNSKSLFLKNDIFTRNEMLKDIFTEDFLKYFLKNEYLYGLYQNVWFNVSKNIKKNNIFLNYFDVFV